MIKKTSIASLALLLAGAPLCAQQRQAAPEPSSLAYSLFYQKAIDAHLTSKFRNAETSYIAAMAEAKKMPEGSGEYGRSVSLLALAYHMHGYPELAERFYLESLDYAEKHNLATVAYTSLGLGQLYLQGNRLSKAEPLLISGLRFAANEERNSREKYSTASAFCQLAEYYEKRGDHGNAERNYNAALGVFGNKETAFRFLVLDAELMNSYPIILYKAGEFHRKRNHSEKARGYYARALRAWANWTELDSRPALKARALDYKGRTLKAVGNKEGAEEALAGAIRLYKKLHPAKDPRIVEAGAHLAALKK